MPESTGRRSPAAELLEMFRRNPALVRSFLGHAAREQATSEQEEDNTAAGIWMRVQTILNAIHEHLETRTGPGDWEPAPGE